MSRACTINAHSLGAQNANNFIHAEPSRNVKTKKKKRKSPFNFTILHLINFKVDSNLMNLPKTWQDRNKYCTSVAPGHLKFAQQINETYLQLFIYYY